MRSRILEEVIFGGASGRDDAFYPQPRYNNFDREPGTTYNIYADADVAAAITDSRAIYNDAFVALVHEPHYECKLVALSHAVSDTLLAATDDRLVLWFRRPKEYAQALPSVPWTRNDALTCVTRSTNEAALEIELIDVFDHGATGYFIIELTEWYPAIDVVSDLQRVYRDGQST